MGITLTTQQLDDLFDEKAQYQPPIVSPTGMETIHNVPPEIGSGIIREIELCEGISLNILQVNFQDLTIQYPEDPHLVQFMVYLTGVVDTSDFRYADRHHSYIGGGGIQKPVSPLNPVMPQIAVDIHFQPQLFKQMFALPSGELPIELQPILQGDDWQQIFSTKTTPQMRSIVQSIVNCPLQGAIKRLYMQGKVFELVALQLAQLVPHDRSSLKPDTIDQIHHAAEILRSQLEHPPDRITLAQLVGVSDRTLRRGFQQVFGMTVLNYLLEQRMHKAKQLLSEGRMTVAKVAILVGYAHLGRFAAAFKDRFGTTPQKWIDISTKI